MNNIEVLEEWLKEMDEHFKRTHINNTKEREALRFIIQENKELKTKLQEHICIEAHEQVKQLYVPKSKIKEIIYPTPENPISFELQSSVMYKKLERLVEGE